MELVRKLGIFKIVKTFDIVFRQSVVKLKPFMLYFFLMLITYSTTEQIFKKNIYRHGKIGSETGEYSVDFYEYRQAIQKEDWYDLYLVSFTEIWKAMVQGDFEFQAENGPIMELYFIFFQVLIVLFSNVILLSLINAVLGDVYSEVITIIDKKLLKEQNLINLENEAFIRKINGQSQNFAWVEYVEETHEVWKGQMDILIQVISKVKELIERIAKIGISQKNQYQTFSNDKTQDIEFLQFQEEIKTEFQQIKKELVLSQAQQNMVVRETKKGIIAEIQNLINLNKQEIIEEFKNLNQGQEKFKQELQDFKKVQEKSIKEYKNMEQALNATQIEIQEVMSEAKNKIEQDKAIIEEERRQIQNEWKEIALNKQQIQNKEDKFKQQLINSKGFNLLNAEKLEQIKVKIQENVGELQDIDLVYLNRFDEKQNFKSIQKIYTKLSVYNSFIISVRSQHDKIFAFFVPFKFQQTDDWVKTQAQICWYWINDDQLITVIKQKDPEFRSNDEHLIEIRYGIGISNNNKEQDYASLSQEFWQGIKQGNDGYPHITENKFYLIAAGEDSFFKHTHFEFYGVNIITK